MYKKDCFAYLEKNERKKCTALHNLYCDGCKFYKTQQDYNLNVLPLKNKKKGWI